MLFVSSATPMPRLLLLLQEMTRLLAAAHTSRSRIARLVLRFGGELMSRLYVSSIMQRGSCSK